MNKKNIVCSCGGANGANHPVSENGCFRYHVTDENEIPKNRRQWKESNSSKDPVWIWDIGESWVTEYTLYNQRLYSKDKNGNWTRPKSKDSINSLEGDW